MAKRGLGKLVAFAAVAGAVAAGVSYVLQYKTYHKELEKDFREFEEGEEEDEEDQEQSQDSHKVNRNYISLTSSKDEFKVAAKDMAQATRNVLKDAGSLLSDTAHEAVSAAMDTAHMAIHTVKAKKDEFMDGRDKDEDEDIFEDEGFLDDDYVDEDDLYDYERMEHIMEPQAEDDPEEALEEPVIVEASAEDGEKLKDLLSEEEEAAPARETALIEEDTIE